MSGAAKVRSWVRWGRLALRRAAPLAALLVLAGCAQRGAVKDLHAQGVAELEAGRASAASALFAQALELVAPERRIEHGDLVHDRALAALLADELATAESVARELTGADDRARVADGWLLIGVVWARRADRARAQAEGPEAEPFAYDAAIATWIEGRLAEEQAGAGEVEQPLRLELPLRQVLRYGENPHQGARWFGESSMGWGAARQLQGKELSYNNLIDLEAALTTVAAFGYGPGAEPAAVVIKHTNPCGVALGDDTADALLRALDADRVSAFGGIVALNGAVDRAAADHLAGLFLECVVAPSFSEEARRRLAAKANLRLLELDPRAVAEAIDLQVCDFS